MPLIDRIWLTAVHLTLLLLAAATLYPLLHVLFASFSDGDQLMAQSGLLWKPVGFSTFAYVRALQNEALWIGYWNTIQLVFGGLVLNLSLTIIGAYVLSRRRALWIKPLTIFIVITLFFNAGIIPFYLVIKGMGLINSPWSLLLPFAIKTFHLLIMRTAFLSLPPELEESAEIDGAGALGVLRNVIVPLSLPVISVIMLYTAVEKWNMWFIPSLFIQDRMLYPLQLVLREILISNVTETISAGSLAGEAQKIGETIKYATIVLATAPLLVIYPFLQKHFVKGALIGAVKS